MVPATAVSTPYLRFGHVTQADSAVAYPTALCSGNTDHQSVVRYVLGHHSSSGNEAVLPKCYSADDGCISPNGSASLDERLAVLMLAAHVAARIDHVRKDHGRSAEDIILQFYSGINGDVILDLHVVANFDAWADDNVLTKIAFLAQLRAAHDVREMPDLRTIANLAACVDDGGRVYPIIGRQSDFDRNPFLSRRSFASFQHF